MSRDVLFRFWKEGYSGRARMTIDENRKPAIHPKAAVAAVVFFTATNSIFFKLSTVPAMVFVSYRFFLCAAAFLAVLVIRAVKEKGPVFSLSGRQFCSLFAIGFVFSFGAFVYFIALKETALSSVLILNSSNAVFVVLFSILFLKDRPGMLVVLSVFVTLGGCAIVFSARTGGTNSLLGNACALACAVCAALYMVFMKRFAALDVAEKLCVVYMGSFFFALMVSLIQGNSFTAFEDGSPYPYYEYLWMACSAIFSVCIPQAVINWALRYVKATFTGSLTLLEPIIATVYGSFLWDDLLSARQIAGGILAIGGLYFYNWAENKNRIKEHDLEKGKQ